MVRELTEHYQAASQLLALQIIK